MADDEKPCPCSWMEKAKAISLVAGALTTVLASVTAAAVGLVNNNHISDVKNGQAEQVQRAEEVQGALTERAKITDSKLGKIETTTVTTQEAVQDTLGPQLWSTWKYLENLAETTQLAEDVAKAREAKKAYENHVQKTKK